MSGVQKSRTSFVSEDRELYKYDDKPFNIGFFQPEDEEPHHNIFFAEYGDPNGIPIVCLHGGPGGGNFSPDLNPTAPGNSGDPTQLPVTVDCKYRNFFHKKYRLVMFDQRGSGLSTPFASLHNNTTWHLVKDIETLRKKLGIEKWIVFGGSWGSTLALAYASKHPERITGMILRGIFTVRKSEIDFLYQNGASHIFPEDWENYLAPIPENERHDMVTAYHKRLSGDDEVAKIEAAKAWTIWEGRTSKLFQDPNFVKSYENEKFALAFARIENHYFFNRGFFETDSYLLDSVPIFRHIPAVIVQGRYDVVCPATTAYELHKRWPEAKFIMVPDAGHNAFEPGIQKALLDACDEFAKVTAE